MAGRTPPRFVPTLTEVVAGPRAAASEEPLTQEQLVHRIMQRIDLTLDRRLREAIASVVIEHSRQLAPALRDEIEAVVSAAVSEALAEELGPERAGTPASPR
jgi:flagellar biosynthesis/type III secretory pathway protein FliH